MPLMGSNEPNWNMIDYSPKRYESKGLTKLLGRALVDRNFRSVLLHNPKLALKGASDDGKSFKELMTTEERAVVMNHQETSLTGLASLLVSTLYPD